METTKVERKATTSDAEWTVQCCGRDCGLVLQGPLAGKRVLPFLPYASGTYCADCLEKQMAQIRARHGQVS